MVGHDLGLVVVAPRAGSRPPLDLDFIQGRHQRDAESVTTFTALSGTSFSRAGAGTAQRADGTLASFATGAPRITDRGLLLEGSRTNRLLYSADLSAVNWSRTGTTATAGRVTATGSGNHICFQSMSYTAGVDQAASVAFAKGNGFAFLQLCYSNPDRYKVTIDLATGAISQGGIGSGTGSASVADLGDRWMLTIVGQSAIGGGGYFNIGLATALSGETYNVYAEPTFASSGQFVDVSYPQLEVGASRSAPIATTGAAATRGADAAGAIAPAGVASWTATYGAANTVVGGLVTPGATFDLVAGRPWIGLGKELKRLVMG